MVMIEQIQQRLSEVIKQSGLAQTPLSGGVHLLPFYSVVLFCGGCLNARRSRALVYSSTRHSAITLFYTVV